MFCGCCADAVIVLPAGGPHSIASNARGNLRSSFLDQFILATGIDCCASSFITMSSLASAYGDASTRIAITKPLFAWDCLDDGLNLKTIEQFLRNVPDAALPAFVTPAVLDVLVDRFNIAPVGTPQADIEAMLPA